MRREIHSTLGRLVTLLLLVAMLLVVLDQVYYLTLYRHDLREHSPMAELSQRPVEEQADVIYLGESSNHNRHEADTDRRTIAQMIDSRLEGHHVADMAHNATHAGHFYTLMDYVPRSYEGVRVAVVTVNMRSFTSEWIYSNLETPLSKQQVLMGRGPVLYRRMLLAFKAYLHWSEQEREELVKQGLRQQFFEPPAGVNCNNADEWDYQLFTDYSSRGVSSDTIEMACHYVKCFALTLDGSNPRIRDLDRIVRLCKQRGWQPVFHILADNEEQMVDMVGPELVELLHRNAQFVQQRYESMGVVVVNNQGIVHDADFNDRTFPTEHYAQRGRRAIADAVADAILQSSLL